MKTLLGIFFIVADATLVACFIIFLAGVGRGYLRGYADTRARKEDDNSSNFMEMNIREKDGQIHCRGKCNGKIGVLIDGVKQIMNEEPAVRDVLIAAVHEFQVNKAEKLGRFRDD